MASNRILLINEEIQKELSSLLRTVKDPRVQDVMISITRVETTPDLRYTKVYVSFLQEDKANDAMKGLKSAAGYLRRQLGTNLRLRYAPEIVWSLDDSITYGAKMLGLINSLGVKHDEDSYKSARDIVRGDEAEFEDYVYQMQDDMLSAVNE